MRRPHVVLLIALFFSPLGSITRADPPPATQPTNARGLEFHILVYDKNDPGFVAMNDRMKPGGQGPAQQPGDSYRWFEAAHPEMFDGPGLPAKTVVWNDKHYLPALITPEASMDNSKPWAVARAYPTSDDLGHTVVGFQLDENGKTLFGDLTTRWQPKNGVAFELAMIVDGKIISAPFLRGAITGGSGIIEGGQGGYTPAEAQRLIDELNTPNP